MKRTNLKQIYFTVLAITIIVTSFSAKTRYLQAASTMDVTQRYSSSEVIGVSEYSFENKNLIMSIDKDSTVVSIKLKNGGKVWGTNPAAEELGKVANEKIREELSSQVVISYTTDQGKDAILDNYTESIAKKQFTISKLENGFRVDYIIGNAESIVMVPEVMEAKKFEGYLSKMSKDDKETVLDYYNFYEYDKIKSESAKKELLAKIPKLKTISVYAARTLVPKVEKALAKIFVAAGLTASDILSAYQETGFVSEGKDSVRFLISIEYLLDNESFSVTVPKDSLEYDTKRYFIKNISLLKYFGAQAKGHSGYILVPDGSGAIINLDTTKALSYSKSVYGDDYTYSSTQFMGYNENTALPVYGIKSDEEAFFAVIEKNASCASITAGSSANSNGYNFVNGDFKITPSEYFRMSAKSRNGMTIFSEKELSDDISTRYFFISGEDANYSGMAKKYRDYLFADRKKIESDSKSPLFLESYGSIQTTSYDFGFPIKIKKELTTYLQAKEIITELNENGIETVNFKYVGWGNGGMENKAPTKVALLRNLGGKSDFETLVKFFDDTKNNFYPDVELEYFKVNSLFDGFTPKKDAARNLDNTIARKFDFNVATLTPNQNSYKYLISSDKYLSFAAQFVNSYKKYEQTGISLGTLGKNLNSNFYVKQNEISREESSKNIAATLDYFAKQNYDIMTTYGNAYTLPYVSKIINMPVDGSNYDIEEYTIPFMQMVFHGYIDYAGSAINLAGDYGDLLLKSVESGANLHFVINYAKTQTVKNTDYSYMFATEYASLKPSVISDYKKVAKLMDLVRAAVITSHVVQVNGLRITVYDNNVSAVINYTENDILYNNTNVPARDFVVIQQ